MLRKSAMILALVAFGLLAVVSAGEEKFADEEILKKQKSIYDLLWKTDLPEIAKKLNTEGVSYNIEANIENYKNPLWVKEFLQIYKRGLIPHGVIFNVLNPSHLEEAKALFKLFLTAKDFLTLYKTAAWAKVYVNEYLFVYSFSVVVFHHSTTKGLRIPALHEIYPERFFDTQVIEEARNIKAYVDATHDLNDGLPRIIHANYSDLFTKYSNYDQWKLSYHTEDIQLNSVPYYAHLAAPFWISNEEFPEMKKTDRYDTYFSTYKHLLTRYLIERLSNGMGDIEDFDWNQPINYPYKPTFIFRNGIPPPHRESGSRIPYYNYRFTQKLIDLEHRISAATDLKFYYNTDGKLVPFPAKGALEMLTNIIEGNANSPNSEFYGEYDRLLRTALGFGSEDDPVPSTLQLYGLDQRDPIYWIMIRRILEFYRQFLSKLPQYPREKLELPGVKIESVDMKSVTTYSTAVDYYISNAVKSYSGEKTPVIKARQYRLAHKPYSVNITVHSDKKTKAIISILLSSKYDFDNVRVNAYDHWHYFMLFDRWVVDLEVGTNKFVRSSNDAYDTWASEEPSGDVFYQEILKAIGNKSQKFQIPSRLYGYPMRAAFPKGNREGFECQFLVFISHFNGEEIHDNNLFFGGKHFPDVPLDFPLHRPVPYNFTDLPNGYLKEFKIFNVEETDINRTSIP